MTLSVPSWSSTLQNLLKGFGFAGPDLQKFTDVIAEGSVNTLVGTSFATVDTGTISGTNAPGSGLGLFGVPPGIPSSIIIAESTAKFGGAGPELGTTALAIELTLIQELTKVTLTSQHTPVHIGAGVVVPGSIPVVGQVWGANITQAGAQKGFAGPQWPTFASVIGNACAIGMQTATGTVVINGPGSSSGAGAGSGSGKLS